MRLRPLLIGTIVFALLCWGAWLVYQRMSRNFDRGFDAAAQRWEQAQQASPSPAPVRLVILNGVDWFSMNWGVFVVLAALALASSPETLWTRWLAWPAALVMLAVGGALVAAGWPKPNQVLEVGPAGVTLHTGTSDAGEAQRRSWAQIERTAILRRTSSAVNRNPPRDEKLVFFEAGGKRFVAIEVPMKLDDEWNRLLQSLRAWSGRPLQSELWS